jgi:hypothetical protein
MSTYEQLRGARLKFLDQDPANASGGQVWYNSTTGKDRVQGIGSAAWSSASPMGSPRKEAMGFGVQTAAVACGGVEPPQSAKVEEYNGTGFSAGTDMPAARGVGVSCGTATAGLVSNGEPVPSSSTIEYDGSTWTTGGAMPVARRFIFGCGIQTAAIAAGGIPPTTASNNSYEYDGSSWTALPNIGTARRFISAAGTTTAGIIYGGSTFPSPITALNNSEEWDGSSWTEGNNLNTAREGGYNFGTQTTAVIAGGNTRPGFSTATEDYDGSSWATSPATLGSANYGGASSGNAPNTAAVVAGGANPTINGITQEYNFSATTLTAAAWASGGALPSGRQSPAGFGSKTAAVACGGEEPGTPGVNTTDNYDGTSWTNSGNYPFAASEIGALGTQTAGIGMGGYQVPSPRTRSNASNEYDGSTWTAGGTYPISASNVRGCGTQTAALGVAGDTYPPAPTRNSDVTAEYNGTTWTAGGSLGTAGYAGHAGGTQTEAVFSGGTGRNSLTEEYNGSSWSTGGAPLYPIAFGGHTNGSPASNFATFGSNASANNNQLYDGTAYATQPSLGTNRQSTGGAGSSGTAGIVFGGRVPPSFRTETEEFTGETTTPAPAQSLTTSS